MQGRIKFINARDWNGKTLYSIKLEGDEALYMCGTSKPPVSQGDYVTFDFKQNPKGQNIVDGKSIKAKAAEVVAAATQGGRESYWNDRQKADDGRQKKIEWQAARNSAIAAADVIITSGALKLPAKESAKYEALLALISDLTRKFYDETNNFDAKPKAAMPTEVAPAEETQGEDESEEWNE